MALLKPNNPMDAMRSRNRGVVGRVCACVVGALAPYNHGLPLAGVTRLGIKRIFLSSALCILSSVSCSAVHAAAPGEYEVKAAFIHNIARFVEWPDAPADGRLRLCTLGKSALSDAAAVLAGERIDGMRWEVRKTDAKADLRECKVLLIASSESDNLERILESIRGSAIMTVGNDDGYVERGVMFGFYLENNKVRIKINAEAAKRAGLKVSSQLLKLARIVRNEVE